MVVYDTIEKLLEYTIDWGKRCFVVKGISRSIGPIHNFSFGFNSFVRPEMALQINAGKSVDWWVIELVHAVTYTVLRSHISL